MIEQHELLEVQLFFPSPINIIEKLEFLDVVKEVSNEYLANNKQDVVANELYPICQTNNMNSDERLKDFLSYVSQSAWNILDGQGYDLTNLSTHAISVWAQEHMKGSGHGEHVHASGTHITGFYILEASDDCSKITFHDPRTGKRQIDLPEKSLEVLSIASRLINVTPKPGMLIFTNSYIPHEITRNPSNSSFKFVHFNVGVAYLQDRSSPPSSVNKIAAIII